MKSDQTAPKTVDEYIAGFPPAVQELLTIVRATIREVAPDAGEKISYQIPTFTLNGTYLVYFAAHKKHIALYPAPVGVPEFAEDFVPYETSKGTVRFPLDKPLPLDLIRKIVKYRLQENQAKAAAKGKKY